jgi:Polyketide cyclase / dehydrase and lipid transport
VGRRLVAPGGSCHDRWPMDLTAELLAPCDRDELFGWVGDLARYPEWLEIVPRAVPTDPHPDDPGPAWSVDLRGRLGPFARAKRLRMVRAVHEPPHLVRFERAEHDGRDHSPWVLTAEVAEVAEANGADGGDVASRLTMRMHYGGGLAGPLMEKLLVDEIERSRPRLLALVTTGAPPQPR